MAENSVYYLSQVPGVDAIMFGHAHAVFPGKMCIRDRRESVIWFDLHEDEQSLKNKVAEHPHSKFLVCNEDIDHIIGYVDSKDLLNRVLANQSLVLTGGVQIRNTLIAVSYTHLTETAVSSILTLTLCSATRLRVIG